MRVSTAFLCALSLVMVGAACSDDGIAPQSDATGSPAGTTGADEAATEGQDGASGGGGTDGPSNGSTGGDGSTTGGVGSSGPEGTGTGTAGTGQTDGTSTDGDSSTGEGSSTGEACVPLADGAAIGQDCGPGGVMCPPEYTCQPFAGIVFQESCQIICTQDCECPMGMACQEIMDKGPGSWFQCV